MKNLWPDTLPEARAVQDRLRPRVKILPLKKLPATIAAVDAGFVHDVVIAVASVYSFPALEHKGDAVFRERVKFPYVPGYFTFREGHAIIGALNGLRTAPEVILVDGHGVAHPRGIGIASHIGVILGIPSIGCAKSRLVGDFDEPMMEKGNWTYLRYEGVPVGAVLRTRACVKPVFVSPGHLTDIPSSVEIVMKCISYYRIPDPLRRVDMLSKKLSRERRSAECFSSKK
jgi:deoxyribonuclease V